MGMAHRGRLNVLCSTLRKSFDELFEKFSENYIPDTVAGDGDVKYHLGYESVLTTTGILVSLLSETIVFFGEIPADPLPGPDDRGYVRHARITHVGISLGGDAFLHANDIFRSAQLDPDDIDDEVPDDSTVDHSDDLYED